MGINQKLQWQEIKNIGWVHLWVHLTLLIPLILVLTSNFFFWGDSIHWRGSWKFWRQWSKWLSCVNKSNLEGDSHSQVTVMWLIGNVATATNCFSACLDVPISVTYVWQNCRSNLNHCCPLNGSSNKWEKNIMWWRICYLTSMYNLKCLQWVIEGTKKI